LCSDVSKLKETPKLPQDARDGMYRVRLVDLGIRSSRGGDHCVGVYFYVIRYRKRQSMGEDRKKRDELFEFGRKVLPLDSAGFG
jgi:hypothetical protein